MDPNEQERVLRTLEHALWGPPGRPNGIVGDVAEIKEQVVQLRKDTKDELKALGLKTEEEARDIRRAVRNLVFAMLLSGLGVVLTQALTQ